MKMLIGELAAVRLEGWESRLAGVLEWARGRSYQLGEHDCFRVTCRVVEALTGVDRWPQFAGRYSTRRESLALLKQYGSSFDAAFDWFFGVPHESWRMARRGDIVKCVDETGEAHLGVCTGGEIAVLREHGLTFEPLPAAHHCWRVG